ncbi:MAG: type VII toxin-antitoxin system MntA family adenylyltransferase antitoxin [Pseudonocardia sp.]
MEVPAEVTALLGAVGVRFAYLFGSRATRTHRPDSDADVAVLADEPLPLLVESRLAVDLAAALDVPRVDLVDLRRAPLRLLGRILAEGIVIHGRDEPDRVEFEVVTRGMYFDFLPMQRTIQDAYLRRVAAEGL